MSAGKKFTTTAEILLFVKPSPGAESSHCIPAGTTVESIGEPVERFSKGANESAYVFQPVKVSVASGVVSGWVLANRLEEVAEQTGKK